MEEQIFISDDNQVAILAWDFLPLNFFWEKNKFFMPTLLHWELEAVSNTGPSQSQNSLSKWSVLSICWWPMSWDMGPLSPWSLPFKTPCPQKRWKSRCWPPRTETELLCGVASRWLRGAPSSRAPEGHVRNSFLGPQVGIHAMDNNTTIHKF